MQKEDDYDWEFEAGETFGLMAQSEFERIKLDLKRKAGLLPLPLHTRVKNFFKGLIERIRGKR